MKQRKQNRISIAIIVCLISLLMMHSPLTAQASSQASSGMQIGYLDKETNRTYVPLRFISEKFQSEVTWDQKAQKITIIREDRELELIIGSREIWINGEKREIDAAPFIDRNTTYVPLRFVSESLQLPFEFDRIAQTIQFQLEEGALKIPIISLEDRNRKAVQLEKTSIQVDGRKINATILYIDLLNPNLRLKVGLAHDQVGAVQELREIAKKHNALIAINGTFFNAYTDDDYKQPYGDLVIDGEWVHYSGENRTVLIFDANNRVDLVSGLEFRTIMSGQMGDREVEGALQAGPRLVKDGEISVDPANEGFRDPKILTQVGARSAFGVTSDHKLILLTTPGATIPQLAEVMQKLGAVQAMNLDGGASSGLYYDGKYLTTPGRLLSNALMVVPVD